MSKEFKLEVGKFYKDRRGEVFGPMRGLSDYGAYCFSDGEGSSYTENGDYIQDEESEYDFVEEVPNPYKIKPEEIVKITDDDNRPTIEEVLSAIQRGDDVTAIDSEWNEYPVKYNSHIQELIDAKSFEIKVKQPVVKYFWTYQEEGKDLLRVSCSLFTEEEFSRIMSGIALAFFEPIQATRKEF